MENRAPIKYFFIINPGSGSARNKTNYHAQISEYFKNEPNSIEFFELPQNCSCSDLKLKIESIKPEKVIAVGGDGTVKLVAEGLMDTKIPLGILPAGSANGMAKELGISEKIETAIDTIVNGEILVVHAVQINEHLCIHLSDIGFNAFIIKKFETLPTRGMWTYLKAAWKVLWSYDQMQVKIKTDKEEIHRRAAMVVIANATKYGTGAVINPKGSLTDELFEIIIVRKISLKEIFKMKVTHLPFDCAKTEVFQTGAATIKSRHKVHFQVDGEYLGKLNTIDAAVLPNALRLIIPRS